MKRKSFLVLMLLCAFGLSTVVAISPPTPYIPPPPPSTPTPPGTPPAISTIYVYPHSYGLAPNQQIQSEHPLADALKLVKPGWEIVLNSGVYNGTYILATRDIRLVGNNATINGSVTISAPGIRLSNVKIVYMPYEGEDNFRVSDIKTAKFLPNTYVYIGAVNILSDGVVVDSVLVNTDYIGVYIAGSHVTVKDSKVITTDRGIMCYNSNDILISNNLIEPPEGRNYYGTGIECYNCSAVIVGDTIKRMYYGIRLDQFIFYEGADTKVLDTTTTPIPTVRVERCTIGECVYGIRSYVPIIVKQCSFYLDYQYGVYLGGTFNFTIVGNNFIEPSNAKAIYLSGAEDGLVDSNIINCSNNQSSGIYLDSARNITISNNLIEHIRVSYSYYINAITLRYSNYNKIVNNTISDITSYYTDSRYSGNAICLYRSNHNLVLGNTISNVNYVSSSGSDTAGAGVLVYAYYSWDYSYSNVISSNKISNVVFGIREYNERSDTISNNRISNACVGIWLDQDVSSVSVNGNHISNCSLWTQHIPEGMHISAMWSEIYNNTIQDCYRGINLRAAQHCILKGNVIENCQDGLRLEYNSYRYSEYNTIYGNVFDNVVNVGYCNDYPNTWNTTVGNYWSDYKSKYPNATAVGMFYSQPYVINSNDIDYKPVVSPEYLTVPTPLKLTPVPALTPTPVAVNNPQNSLTKVQIFNKIMEDIGAYAHATNPSTKAKIFNEIMNLIKLYAS